MPTKREKQVGEKGSAPFPCKWEAKHDRCFPSGMSAGKHRGGPGRAPEQHQPLSRRAGLRTAGGQENAEPSPLGPALPSGRPLPSQLRGSRSARRPARGSAHAPRREPSPRPRAPPPAGAERRTWPRARDPPAPPGAGPGCCSAPRLLRPPLPRPRLPPPPPPSPSGRGPEREPPPERRGRRAAAPLAAEGRAAAAGRRAHARGGSPAAGSGAYGARPGERGCEGRAVTCASRGQMRVCQRPVSGPGPCARICACCSLNHRVV